MHFTYSIALNTILTMNKPLLRPRCRTLTCVQVHKRKCSLESPSLIADWRTMNVHFVQSFASVLIATCILTLQLFETIRTKSRSEAHTYNFSEESNEVSWWQCFRVEGSMTSFQNTCDLFLMFSFQNWNVMENYFNDCYFDNSITLCKRIERHSVQLIAKVSLEPLQ